MRDKNKDYALKYYSEHAERIMMMYDVKDNDVKQDDIIIVNDISYTVKSVQTRQIPVGYRVTLELILYAR